MVWPDKRTDRERDRQTDRQRQRDREGHTENNMYFGCDVKPNCVIFKEMSDANGGNSRAPRLHGRRLELDDYGLYRVKPFSVLQPISGWRFRGQDCP